MEDRGFNAIDEKYWSETPIKHSEIVGNLPVEDDGRSPARTTFNKYESHYPGYQYTNKRVSEINLNEDSLFYRRTSTEVHLEHGESDEHHLVYDRIDTSDSPFGKNASGEYCPMFGLTGKDNPNWKGGRENYGEGWNDSKKEKIRDRHNRRCADPDCRVHEDELDEKLHVHHIVPARAIGDAERRNDPSNLVALCSTCHSSKWETLSAFEQREMLNI